MDDILVSIWNKIVTQQLTCLLISLHRDSRQKPYKYHQATSTRKDLLTSPCEYIWGMTAALALYQSTALKYVCMSLSTFQGFSRQNYARYPKSRIISSIRLVKYLKRHAFLSRTHVSAFVMFKQKTWSLRQPSTGIRSRTVRQ